MNGKKNIGILVPSIETGGMERTASRLSKMLSEYGFNVFLIVFKYDRLRAYPYKGKIIVSPCKIDNSSFSKEVISYIVDAGLIKDIKKKYNIETTISISQEMNLINILSDVNDKKILTIHNCMSVRTDINSLAYNKIIMLLSNLAYKIVTVSEWCANDLHKKYFLPKKKITVIYNPLGIKHRERIEKDKKPIVLTVGRLEKVKRQWHIIKAFKSVHDRIPGAELWLAGDGPEKEKLEKLAEQLKIKDKVKFLGFVKNVDELYGKAKIFVLSSESESFSCVAVEAMANGIPIVASDFPGGIREVVMADYKETKYPIDAAAGYITKNHEKSSSGYSADISQTEYEMGRAMEKLLLNESIYREKSQNCIKNIGRFDSERILAQWTELLKD